MKEKIVKCEKGWECLYKPIIDEIQKHDSIQTSPNDKIGIEEIKEKYGMLSIKLINEHNLTDKISDMITKAIRNSLNVCEYCGTMNNVGVTMNFWYKTCCEKCWRKHILSSEPKSIWKGKFLN